MITVAEAYGILDAAVRPFGVETVSLADAAGRILAEDVAADVDWPPFDTSAMDGYALRAKEVAAADASLAERAGVVAAGDSPPPALGPGEAVRLMTGAPLPGGADAIVPVEESRRADGRVFFDRVPDPGAHVRRRGESISRGTVLLRAGERLRPAAIALAALAGCDPISVRRRPRVAVVTTGNELVAAAETPAPGQLRDSNGPMLRALCRARGWEAVDRGTVTDDERSVARLFADLDADVLVTSGGVSAGDLDLLPGAAERAGWEILFHKVAVRPGKPIVFARRGDRFWLGLPGNPVSASVCFHLFARRALDRMEGIEPPGAPTECARLSVPLPPQGPRETYRDAVLRAPGGVEPLTTRGSHDIATHARADALIRVPAGSAALPEGSLLTCVLLER